MTDENSKYLKIFEKTSSDHIQNIFTAGLASIPFVGGSIAFLFTEYMPSAKEERLKVFLANLREDVDLQMKGSLNVDKIQSPEYAYIFEKCFRGVSENYQAERLDAYKAIIVNSLINTTPSEDKSDLFISFVNNLPVIHIRILSFFNNFPKHCIENNLDSAQITQKDFKSVYSELKLEMDFDIFCSVCEQLFLHGLTIYGSNVKNLTLTKVLNERDKVLTKLGMEFVDFITLK